MKIQLPPAPQLTGTVFAPHAVPPTHALAPPAPVEVTKFEEVEAPIQVAPVPPPPEPPLPTTYEGYIELAKMVSKGPMTDKAHLWVRLAQAESSHRIANALEELLEMISPTVEEGEEAGVSVLAAVIAEGIVLAAQEQEGAIQSMQPEKKNGKKQ